MEFYEIIILILSVFGFFLNMYFYRTFWPLRKLVSHAMSLMVNQRWDKVRANEFRKETDAAKIQIGNNIRAKIPLGLADGVSDLGLFGLATDPDFMTGAAVLIQSGASVIQTLTGAFENVKLPSLPGRDPKKTAEW